MLKYKVLKLLGESYISGQEICEKLGVSRTAIWKAITALKLDGYRIEAGTNRGYRLIKDKEKLGKVEIDEKLEALGISISTIFKDSIDSTNALAKNIALSGEVIAPFLVVADEQVAGKGRRGRSWQCPPGSGIAMSLCIKPGLDPRHASMITLIAAVSVAQAITQLSDLSPHIKWPNDVIVENKKVCGILTEMSADMDEIHYIVCGIGINVNNKSLPEDIERFATSLYKESGEKFERSVLVATITGNMLGHIDALIRDKNLASIKDVYEAYLINIGKTVRILEDGDSYEAVATGIDTEGALCIEKEGEKKKIISGEVSVRGLYGYV